MGERKYTVAELYGKIDAFETRRDAREYFKQLVRIHMECSGLPVREAIRREKDNVGYMAGYYDPETRNRIMRLFRASHPLFSRRGV